MPHRLLISSLVLLTAVLVCAACVRESGEDRQDADRTRQPRSNDQSGTRFDDPMLNASRDGDASLVRELIEAGTDPNMTDALGNSPLTAAAHFGRTSVIELLVQKGADVNGNGDEMSPLHCAVYSRQSIAAELLLSLHADPNLADRFGTTPLLSAAHNGAADLTVSLLQAGANIEQADKRGWHPLHVALRSGLCSDADRLATVTALLERGADPNALNPGGFETDSEHDSHVGAREDPLPNRGNTPVAIAASNGFLEIVELLKSHGGQ